jgi:hypothetical protein
MFVVCLFIALPISIACDNRRICIPSEIVEFQIIEKPMVKTSENRMGTWNVELAEILSSISIHYELHFHSIFNVLLTVILMDILL